MRSQDACQCGRADGMPTAQKSSNEIPFEAATCIIGLYAGALQIALSGRPGVDLDLLPTCLAHLASAPADETLLLSPLHSEAACYRARGRGANGGGAF